MFLVLKSEYLNPGLDDISLEGEFSDYHLAYTHAMKKNELLDDENIYWVIHESELEDYELATLRKS